MLLQQRVGALVLLLKLSVCKAGALGSLGDRSVDTDTFSRVHSNARTVHPL